MKIIKAGYEIMPKFDNRLKKIELVARTCYKSEDSITEDSCIKMVDNLIKREHYAMLEHASLAIMTDSSSYLDTIQFIRALEEDGNMDMKNVSFKSYLNYTQTYIPTIEKVDKNRYIISGNIRAWFDFLEACMEYKNRIPLFFKNIIYASDDIFELFKNFKDADADGMFIHINDVYSEVLTDMSILTCKERLVHENLTVKFTVDRGVTHELVRHRDCSFAQESTRYCNYSKGKFGNEITVIKPCFLNEKMSAYKSWYNSCSIAEKYYFEMLEYGCKPQEARDILPTSVKADIIMTANIREWIHILELRALGITGTPHPQMLEVMVPLAKELVSGVLSDFTYMDSVNKMLSL